MALSAKQIDAYFASAVVSPAAAERTAKELAWASLSEAKRKQYRAEANTFLKELLPTVIGQCEDRPLSRSANVSSCSTESTEVS